MLSLQFLGSFQISMDGRPVAGFAYNKARALLAYLVIEADRPHPREELVGLLWPEMPERPARTNLRQALANLREAIGDSRAIAPYLLVSRDSVQFNLESRHTADATTFLALLHACQEHRHRRRESCPPCATRIANALELYRGSFLPGFSLPDSAPFEEWALLRREQFHLAALDAAQSALRYHAERGEYDLAQGYARQQLELDPWREEAHRDLMRLLWLTGQRSAALQQYRLCQQVLAREFGVDPAPETAALHDLIRRGEGPPPPAPPQLSLHGIAAPPGNSFVGREQDQALLDEWLADPGVRLITITGVAGVGKSRLAIQAAARHSAAFRHGAAFISLSDLPAAERLPSWLRAALIPTASGRQDPQELVLSYLANKELLLVLDDYEHLLPEVEFLSAMLRAGAGVTLLITSRQRLWLQSEWVFQLEGLGYPEPGQAHALESYAAFRLFIDRTRQIRPRLDLDEQDRAAVARICQLVEGLPLAIELAAGTLGRGTLADLADQLSTDLQSLTLPMRDVEQRHHGLWAALDRSWCLLDETERSVLSALSVFHGGITAEAAHQVAGAGPEALDGLADKSLLRRHAPGRYGMHEAIRQFLRAKLQAAGNLQGTRARHLQYFLSLAQSSEPELIGPRQGEWVERLEFDLENLRAALEWSFSESQPDPGLRLAASLWRYWLLRGRLREGRNWLERALAAAPEADPLVRAQAQAGAGVIARTQGLRREALNLLGQSLDLRRACADSRGIASSLNYLGLVALDHGDFEKAQADFEESLSLFQAIDVPHGVALNLYNLGMIALHLDRVSQAEMNFKQCLQIGQRLQDRRIISYALNDLGIVALNRGELETAESRFEQSLQLKVQIGDMETAAWPLEGLAGVAVQQARPLRASHLLGAAEALRESLGSPLPLANRGYVDELNSQLRAQLDQAELQAAWSAGAAMTFDQVLQYACSHPIGPEKGNCAFDRSGIAD